MEVVGLSQTEKLEEEVNEEELLQAKLDIAKIRKYVAAVAAEFKTSEEHALALITQREMAILNSRVDVLIRVNLPKNRKRRSR